MKFATEFSVGAELNVDSLVETKPYEIQWLLHCALLFTSHGAFCLSLSKISNAIICLFVCIYFRAVFPNYKKEVVRVRVAGRLQALSKSYRV